MVTNNTVKERSFKYVSLFAGIGGFDTALNELGGHCVMASEIDKFARKAYETLYGIEPSGDITKIKSEDIPDHDLLTAGFPCQAFSVAGKRAGMAYVCNDCNEEQTLSFDDYADRNFVCSECGGVIEPVDGRGLLFFEVARVARDKQPKALLLENVKGLVGHDKGRTLDTMVKTLNDIGYTIDFEVLNTKYFGLPQNRERIFIVAFRDDLVEATGWSEESRKGNTVVPKGKRRLHGYGNVKSFDFPFPKNDTVTSRLIDVLETEVDEKYYLDDEKTAGLIEELNEGLAVKEATSKGYSVAAEGDSVAAEGDSVNVAHPNSKTRRGRVGKQIANTLVASGIEQAVVESLPMDCEIPQDPNMLGLLDMKGNESIRRVYDPNACGPTLTTMGGGHREPKVAIEEGIVKEDLKIPVKVRKHNVDVEGLQKLLRECKSKSDKTNRQIAEETNQPITKVEHWFRTDSSFSIPEADVWFKLKEVIGISSDEFDEQVTEFVEKPGEFEKGNRVYYTHGQSPTLTSASAAEKVFDKQHRIRKLTPLECWRLQGFTDEQHNAVEKAGISNSQRYKQAGNAVSVPVIVEVAKRMLPYIEE